MRTPRRRLLVEPRFQVPFLARMAGLVGLSTIMTAALVVALLAGSDPGGDYFLVRPEEGSHPLLLSRTQIALPAVALSLAVNLALCLVFALYYSQRLAGPLHRLKEDMLRLARGEKLPLHFQLRESDEWQDVAHAFDTLLRALARPRPDPPS